MITYEETVAGSEVNGSPDYATLAPLTALVVVDGWTGTPTVVFDVLLSVSTAVASDSDVSRRAFPE